MVAVRPNRRRFPRVRIPTETQLRCWGESFRGVVRVLGEGGMFIDTITPTVKDAELEVVIEDLQLIRARCISRDYEAGWGMGVEFLGLPEADRLQVRQLMARYA